MLDYVDTLKNEELYTIRNGCYACMYVCMHVCVCVCVRVWPGLLLISGCMQTLCSVAALIRQPA